MDYYNKIDRAYLTELQNPMRKLKFKVEILSHYEGAIGQITNDLSSAEAGTISINKEQGCRRSCSFTIIDREEKYLPQVDSWFWYNRKFKLYIGVVVSSDTYWFPQGVFITKSATAQGKALSIEGIDKYGFLNGELNTRMCLVEYQASVTNSKKGTKIADLIRDTLMLDLGNNIPLDPVEPLIDPIFYEAELYDDIVVDEGGYLGEIFDKLAEMYGANIYYDVNGRLRMERVFNYNLPSWYRHLSPQSSLGEVNITETDIDVQYNYDGVNIITVATDNTNGEISSYTAKNENPQSPVCITSVGYKGLDGGTYYISLGDTTLDSGEEKCRMQAEYMLLQNTCMGTSISFNYPSLPHLDVDNTIELTNEYYKFKKQLFLIRSLTIPLSNGEMTIEATNLQWLPFDTDCISIYCENSNEKVTVAYNTNGGKDKDGNLVNYSSVSQAPNKQIVLQGADMYNDNKLFYWTDNQGNKYNYGDVYTVSRDCIILSAIWITSNEVTVTTNLTEDETIEFQSLSPSRCLIRYDDNEVLRRNTDTIATFKKKYAAGEHTTTIVSESNTLSNFDNAFDKVTTTKIDCSKVTATYFNNSSMGNDFENLTDFIFPPKLDSIATNEGVLNNCPNIESVTFPTAFCCVYRANTFLTGSTFKNGLKIPYNITFAPTVYVDGKTGTEEIKYNEILKDSHVIGKLHIEGSTTDKCVVYVNAETTNLIVYPAATNIIFSFADKGIDGDLSGLTYIQLGRQTNINSTNGFLGDTSASVSLVLDFTSKECTNKIPKNAFNGYTGTSIGIAYYGTTDSIVIEDGAFCNMSKMTSLPMTNNKMVKTIPKNCMNNLTALTSAKTGYVIDVEGCNDMPNLTSLRIESTCEKVNGFNNCPKLKSLSFMSDGKVTEIGGLNGNAITTFYIPNTTISVSGVNNCPSLTTVSIGKSLESFTGFNNCPLLNTFNVNSANTHFKVVNNCLYQDNKFCRTPASSWNSSAVVVANGTTEIMSNAFQRGSMTSISFPKSLITINQNAIKSTNVDQVIFHSEYDESLGKYTDTSINDLSAFDNVTVGTMFGYSNGITDVTDSRCLPIVKYCIEHNIKFVDMAEINMAYGVVGISGYARLEGDKE